MGLRWSGGRFSFVDSTNEVIAFNPSAEEVGPYAFLISKEKLTPHIPHVYLQEREFYLVTPTGSNDHKPLPGTAKSFGVEG